MMETLSPLGRLVLNLGLWPFVLVSDFVLRISSFLYPWDLLGSREVTARNRGTRSRP